MRLITITNDPNRARAYIQGGADVVMIDCEVAGKSQRQPQGAWISDHSLNDIPPVVSAVGAERLLVRVDGPEHRSKDQILQLLDRGVQKFMLPYFSDRVDVDECLVEIGGNGALELLVETKASADNLDAILEQGGVDSVHVGLNDLSLQLGLSSMFQALYSEELKSISAVCKRRGVLFGIGGIARLGASLKPDPELILYRHVELGSQAVILNRTFCGGLSEVGLLHDFTQAVNGLRGAWHEARQLSEEAIRSKSHVLREQIFGVC